MNKNFDDWNLVKKNLDKIAQIQHFKSVKYSGVALA